MSDGVVYRFEGGELDGARHRLVVDGRPVELEPKAFAVLQDLLAHAGQMRSRDELLDAVWGHRHVTPAVLNRCIGQVRKALGDHAESPRFVQTVHTLGYRFVAPVEAASTAEVVGDEPPSQPPSQPQARPRSLNRRTLAIAACLVALVLIGGLAWQSRDKASAPGELVARAPTQVVLVPFEVPRDAADLEPPVRALESGVLQRLRMLPGLRVERGQARGDAIVLTAEVAGGVNQRQLRVHMRNADAPFDRVYPLKLTTMLHTVLAVQQDIVQALRPDSAALLQSSGIFDSEAMVRSGLRARKGLTLQDQRDAAAAFRRAIELDPSNADAWCFLGGMYLSPAFNSLDSKDNAIPPAREAITRGLRLDPASAHCQAKQGDLMRIQGHLAEAEAAYRRALAIEPTLLGPRASLAEMESMRGHFAKWRDELARIAREHPEVGWLQCMLMQAHSFNGQPDIARAMEPAIYVHHPELRRVNWISAEIDVLYAEPARGIARWREIYGFDPEDKGYLLSIALVLSWLGETAQSKQALADAGFLDTPQYLVSHTWWFHAVGDPQGAVMWLRSAKVSPSLSLLQHALIAQSLAMAGQREAALAEFSRVYESGWEDEDPVMREGFFIHSAQLLNYAALLPVGERRDAVVDAAARHLATMRGNGFAFPWVRYQAAQIAAMRGDGKTAILELDRAIDAGYTDILSLSHDLPWRELDGDPAFAQRKERLASIALAQRRIIAGDGKAGTSAAMVAR
ncbi:winged helix-turn-helix domain-containing protein [Lysobacter sp. A6]|uniref:Winged helix-turn-helix domain-containing protein n=1 Tax=Noviluteimonas lactosilytica TaxID=2888523 RepID=A0ABS8JLZ1_9GAMM|nr:winged helix-turn-helix domain-containing protein [Lysobacter lactosilyticus]MCC8364587.1 winged helix-turn-helix domain-containing protein [Lysobacter lactosilyticus]